MRSSCWFPFLWGLVLWGCGEPVPDPSNPDGKDMVGSQMPPTGSCDPLAPRPDPPELFVGPMDLEARLLAAIGKAQTTLDILMYEMSRETYVDKVIEAHQRGVKVRVILDGKRGDDYEIPQKRLADAGVPVKPAPERFSYAHAKVLIIDSAEAIVMSANMDVFSQDRARNHGVVDRDRDDIADLQAVFEADWAGGPEPDLACTRLLVSPINSLDRLRTLINGAKKTLDFQVMYLTEKDMVAAVGARAKAGVTVRILLATERFIMGNDVAARAFLEAGAQVKFFYNNHAKLIVADGVAFIGSENLSWTSLTKNREVGIFVTEQAPAAAAAAQFDADWQKGVAVMPQ